jgi:hypothetical protein
MTILNRLVVPPDQQPFVRGPSYCCWASEPFTSDWQISLGGVMLGKNSEWCITSVEGTGLPGVRTTDSPEPFLHGVSSLGDFADARKVVVEVTGKFATPELAWDKMRELAGAWQANVQDQLLRFRMTGDRTLVLIGHPRKMSENTAGIRRGIVSASLEFFADDPRFYDAVVSRHTVQLGVLSGEQGFCFSSPMCFDPTVCIPRGSLGSTIVDNKGNARVAPIIVAVGDVGGLRCENTRTGEYWEWNASTGGGELFVDHLSRTVKLDAIDFYGPLAPGSRFFWLDPGETRINIRVTSGEGYASVRFRSGWF